MRLTCSSGSSWARLLLCYRALRCKDTSSLTAFIWLWDSWPSHTLSICCIRVCWLNKKRLFGRILFTRILRLRLFRSFKCHWWARNRLVRYLKYYFGSIIVNLGYFCGTLLNLDSLILHQLFFCLLIDHNDRIEALHIWLLYCLILIVICIDILGVYRHTLRRLFKFLGWWRILFLRTWDFQTLLLFHRGVLECLCFHFLLLEQLLALFFLDTSTLLLFQD